MSGVVVVSYESFAPRSTAQVSRLSRIAALTPGPTARAAAAAAAAASSASVGASNSNSSTEQRGLLSLAMSVSSSSVNTATTTTTTTNLEEKQNENENESSSSSLRLVSVAMHQAQQLADSLTHELKHTTSLRLACRACMNIAEDVSSSHASLIRHSGELSAAADRLQEEAQLMQHHADDIGHPLQHYDAVDRIGILVGVLFKGTTSKTTIRGLAKTKVDNEEYPALLDEIDAAVDYFEKKSGGKEALVAHEKQQQQSSSSSHHHQGAGGGQQSISGNLEYYRRALVLQEAALDLIKQAVADRITSTTQQIAAQLHKNNNPSSSSSSSSTSTTTTVVDQLEASLIYTRFHGISTRSHRLLSLVRARCHKSVAYVDLLQASRTTYCSCRESLLRLPLREYMEKLLTQHGPVGMTRLASVFLIRLLTAETILFLDFFGTKPVATTTTSTTTSASSSDPSDAAKDSGAGGTASSSAVVAVVTDKTFQDVEFQTYLATLCTSLHRTVRRSLVTCLDLDTLCQMVSVLRQEGQAAARQATTLAAAHSMAQVMEDAQERVIFCANTTLRQQVLRFKASPADLDYPKKLQTIKQKASEKATATATSSTTTTTTSIDGEDDVNTAEQQLEQVYESWFPPMRTVLRILSKIFRVVEPVVFEDLALQSIQACTKSLKDGATYILKRQGVLHADLFLVKHLLILREQLSPFDMELRTVERQLDFSDAGKAVARFLANRNRRIFSMSTENNALMTLLREGVSVQESSVDSKRDLEEALKSACNDFIEHTSTSLAGPVLNLLEECKTMDKNKSSSNKTHNADYIQDVLINKTLNDLPSKMDNLLECMGLYLDNPATQSILLKPAIRKVTRATEGVRRWVQTQCGAGDDDESNGAGGWNAEKRAAILDSLNRVDDLVKKVNNNNPGGAAAAATAVAANP